jgi:hypothetical protein
MTRAAGNALTIVSFTTGLGKDQPVPVDQVTELLPVPWTRC